MSAKPFYKRYASDFIAGVAGLGVEQIGVYSVLLDLMYARRAKIPSRSAKDQQGLARMCGCHTRQFNRILESLIALPNKITRDPDGFLSNPRFERLLREDQNNPQNNPQENKTGGNRLNLDAKKGPENMAENMASILTHIEQDQRLKPEVAAPISRAPATHIPYSSNKPSTTEKTAEGYVRSKMQILNGKKNGGTTIQNPQERLARFQKWLADGLGHDGWTLVAAAADPKSPAHSRALALCKSFATSNGKGWPNQWPQGG